MSPTSTLDYSDQPPGSRLIVRRDSDALIIDEPPMALWQQAKVLLLGVAVVGAIISTMVGLLWWRFLSIRGITIAQVQSALLRIVPAWFLDWDFVAVIVFVLAVVAVTSVVGSRIRITANQIVVETYVRWLGRRRGWTWSKALPRREIAFVTVDRSGRMISLRSTDNSSLAKFVPTRRDDARWLARTLRLELGLAQPD